MVGQLVVDIAQPFQGMFGQALRLIAQQHHNVARTHLQLLTQAAHQGKAFLSDRLGLGVAHAGGTECISAELIDQAAANGIYKLASVD